MATTLPAGTSEAGESGHAKDGHEFSLELSLGNGYRQRAEFGDGMPTLVIDEPPPLGVGSGPNPARVLGAAVASCLGASLLFCLRKARVDVRGLRTSVHGRIERNAAGRQRITEINVRLSPVIPAAEHDRITRCVSVFEDFCIVTQSVRQGIQVNVEVVPTDS